MKTRLKKLESDQSKPVRLGKGTYGVTLFSKRLSEWNINIEDNTEEFKQDPIAIKKARIKKNNNTLTQESVSSLADERAMYELIQSKKNKYVGEVSGIVDYYGCYVEFSVRNSFKTIENIELYLEYANGGSLENWIFDKDKPFDWCDAHQFVNDILSGLHFLHQYNIIHCDIKPGNLLLSHEGEVIRGKICDFGLSKEADDNIETRGTSAYMAPEILLLSFPHTPASDMFSLAVVLCEMARREMCYLDIETRDELISHVAIDKKREEIPLEAPLHVYTLIKRAWEHSPSERITARQGLKIWNKSSNTHQGSQRVSVKECEDEKARRSEKKCYHTI
jgi:serine/threonine protein kinase